MSRQPKPLRLRIANAAAIVIFLPLILPLVVAALILFFLHRLVLYVLVWALWLPKGKDMLLVYSNSPVWHDYMSQQVLPLIQDRAIVLNWSERSSWRQWRLAHQVFYSFAGHREFNPLIILFRPVRRAKLFRFWLAFKDWKHGHTEPLERLTDELRLSL
jgi:hypothetical protein